MGIELEREASAEDLSHWRAGVEVWYVCACIPSKNLRYSDPSKFVWSYLDLFGLMVRLLRLLMAAVSVLSKLHEDS